MKAIPLLTALVALAACTPRFVPGDSIATGALPSDTTALVQTMIAFTRHAVPPAQSVLILANSDPADPVAGPLRAALIKSGYGIANATQTANHGHPFRYVVTPMEPGVLLRLYIDDRIATQFFNRDSEGALHRSAEVAVRDVR